MGKTEVGVKVFDAMDYSDVGDTIVADGIQEDLVPNQNGRAPFCEAGDVEAGKSQS